MNSSKDFSSEPVKVNMGISDMADILNAVDDLFRIFSKNFDSTKKEWEAVDYLRSEMKENKELFGSVLVSLLEEITNLCAKYLMLATETDNIKKEIEEKIFKNINKRKVN